MNQEKKSFNKNGYLLAKKLFNKSEIFILEKEFNKIVSQLKKSGENINANWGSSLTKNIIPR